MRAPILSSDVDVGSRLADADLKVSKGKDVTSRLSSSPLKGLRKSGAGSGLVKKATRKGATTAKAVSRHSGLGSESDMEAQTQEDVTHTLNSVGRATGKVGKTGVQAAERTGKVLATQSASFVSATGRTVKKVGAKGAKAVARGGATMGTSVASMVSRVVSKVAAHTAAAVASLASLPVVTIVVATTVIVSIILSVVSWLPGFAAYQENSADSVDGAGMVNFDLADDYPYKGKYGGFSPFGYAYGNCTDFVAWRVNRDAGVVKPPWRFKHDLTPLGGNGGQWGLPGNLPGWNVVTTPSPGDIISIPAGVAVLGSSGGVYGHVAYIAQVTESGVIIENYGRGKYFLTQPSMAQLKGYIASHRAVIKHNPKGRVGGGAGGDPKAYAKQVLKNDAEYNCLVQLWQHESGWRVTAENKSSGAYGIPQALPGSKMASAGADWKTNGITQVKWGLSYIQGRPDYGSPCKAWAKWQSRSPHWY